MSVLHSRGAYIAIFHSTPKNTNYLLASVQVIVYADKQKITPNKLKRASRLIAFAK